MIAKGARKVRWVSARAITAIRAEQKRRKWSDARMAVALRIARPHWIAARTGTRNLPFVAVCAAHRMGVDCAHLLHLPD